MVAENEPNDDIGSPTPYVVGTVVAGTMGKADASMDVDDYYEVVAPAGDPSGGYFQASIAIQVGGGAVFAQVYSGFDNGPLLLADGAPAGQATFFYWAARPGERYLVRLYEGGGVVPTFKYSFKATYTRIADELRAQRQQRHAGDARARHAGDGVLLCRLQHVEPAHPRSGLVPGDARRGRRRT